MMYFAMFINTLFVLLAIGLVYVSFLSEDSDKIGYAILAMLSGVGTIGLLMHLMQTYR